MKTFELEEVLALREDGWHVEMAFATRVYPCGVVAVVWAGGGFMAAKSGKVLGSGDAADAIRASIEADELVGRVAS